MCPQSYLQGLLQVILLAAVSFPLWYPIQWKNIGWSWSKPEEERPMTIFVHPPLTSRYVYVSDADAATDPVSFPYSFDANCSDLATRFAKAKSLPSTALVSYPGSGNTWLRYLLQGATGLYTGSTYKDQTILATGFPGEERQATDGTTLVQTTHSFFTTPERIHKEIAETFRNRGILVIRNPFRAMLAFRSFMQSVSHVKEVEIKVDDKFPQFVEDQARSWHRLYHTWLTHATELHIVFYEDLVSDCRKTVRGILDFLRFQNGYPADRERRLSCMETYPTGQFKRPHSKQLPKVFTRELRAKVKEAIDSLDRKIYEMTGRHLPTEKYEYYNDEDEE